MFSYVRAAFRDPLGCKNNIYQCRGLNGFLSSRNQIIQAIDFTAHIQSLFLGFRFSPQFARHLGILPFTTYFLCSFSSRNLLAPTIYCIPRTISVINLVFPSNSHPLPFSSFSFHLKFHFECVLFFLTFTVICLSALFWFIPNFLCLIYFPFLFQYTMSSFKWFCIFKSNVTHISWCYFMSIFARATFILLYPYFLLNFIRTMKKIRKNQFFNALK